MQIYQVDAFAGKVFSGNPAAVCPLNEWLPDELMQLIAMENNLAETAFITKEGNDYRIRWFTPTVEVDLCGHATLAAAHVLFNHLGYTNQQINFASRSGVLTVTRDNGLVTLNFPTDLIAQVEITESLIQGLNIQPREAYKGKTDYMFVYNNEQEIKYLAPDFRSLANVQARGIIVTAKGDEVDFVSRFFAPQSGIDEDPVTGSAHTSLIPYWSNALGKTTLQAIQLSKRKGYLTCKYLNERIEISGQAKTYLTGEIFIS